jgi:hypothetical protein
MGFAEIYAAKRGKFIKIVSDDGTCYLWDDSTCLWMHHNNKWIGNKVSHVLEKEFRVQMKKYRGRGRREGEEEGGEKGGREKRKLCPICLNVLPHSVSKEEGGEVRGLEGGERGRMHFSHGFLMAQ